MLQYTISEIISERGLTPRDLSDFTNIPIKTIYNWLSDPTMLPSWDRLELICKIFQLQLGMVIIYIDDQDPLLLAAPDRDKYLRCYRREMYLDQHHDMLSRCNKSGDDLAVPIVNTYIYNDCACVAPRHIDDIRMCKELEEEGLLEHVRMMGF